MSDVSPSADAKKRAGRDVPDTDQLPAAEEVQALAAALRVFAELPLHSRTFSFLHRLSKTPPRALLLEGGNADERAAIAIYWGMALNCPNPELDKDFDRKSPCFSCPSCFKFLARMHRDLFFLDGGNGSITIDEVRQVRATLGEAAREAVYRVVILSEAQSLTEAAANAMLKSLEEALPATVFVLTVPQRERLLPTLVSRSWVLTLAWPDPLTAPEKAWEHTPESNAPAISEREWVETAATFLTTGKGLFDRTGARGGVDTAGANVLILTCQRAIAQALSGMTGADITPGKSPPADLACFFAALPENRLSIACSVLNEGQESLACQVNPALVVDWVMTRLYLLRPRGRS